MKWFRKKKIEVHTCEVCGAKDVRRTGVWDYCTVGHVYVGQRAAEVTTNPAAETSWAGPWEVE